MKKILSILLVVTLLVGTLSVLTACTSGSDNGKKELALITDVGTIDDKSFNQGAWEGLEKYAKEKKIAYKYYKPAEKSDVAYLSSIDQAVKAGAKVIVCPGFLFEKPVYQAQTKYPEVKFILLDGAPHPGDYKVDIKENVQSIFYAEEQAGYLAGYAAVKDGYKKLGFMGGMAVPAVIRYGYGFVQGADAAAKELGMKKGDINMKYTYVGNFDASPENQAKAASWYNDGTEVIFACGGAVGNSVMKAAETAGKKVIGVDVDQSSESKTVITSAMKNLGKSVYDAVTGYYNNKWIGGKSINLDAKVNGVELPMKNSKFAKFKAADYDAVYAKLVSGSISLKKDTDAKLASDIPVEIVTIKVI
ncbi:BMP family ABC transporter substrate-binding protein [Paludicola sp. MB14-C6]|uniref:BMP family lipoprotein n=1 Tax=Paludihabitans sp. MB14-C6 TaxID=3070656 RepID=UPI0027DD4214|nr:BMP family ABC transporter substrate-binding protein [Paludicola sp. MB14-C6]WMJ23912.1 BMP family ABC transporter substrate-binding protein [Paludicola sp. MB14-C6]